MQLPSSMERATSPLPERIRATEAGRRGRRFPARRGTLAPVLLLLSALLPVAVLEAQPAPDSPTRGAPPPPAREGRDGVLDGPATRPSGIPGPARPTGTRFGARGGSAGAGGFTGVGNFGGPVAHALGEGPTCKFDATIYDVRMPANQIGKLDVDALTDASATPDAFEKALAALGTVQPLYRASQSVRLSGDTITIGSEVPVVTASHVSEKGQTMNSISYMSTGALFNLAGNVGPSGGVDLDLSIQLSAISDGSANLTDNVKASVMRKATISHKGPVQPRKPFVVVSVDAGSTDKEGKAVAYIGRITLGEPQSPAQPTPPAPR